MLHKLHFGSAALLHAGGAFFCLVKNRQVWLFKPALEYQLSMNQKSGIKSQGVQIWTHTCPVCLEGANGHLHYGSVACFACRGFFRRTTLSLKDGGVGGKSKCGYNGHCEIRDKISRMHCPSCRYDKCISVGMKPEFVMSEQDKKEAKAMAMVPRQVVGKTPYAKKRQEDRCQRQRTQNIGIQQLDQKDETLSEGECLAI